MYIPYDGERYCAFIDETGNFGYKFDKEGCSSHFIITAIIIEYNRINAVRNEIDILRKKHFGNGEMKSSSLSHKKRFRILQDLVNIDFKFLCIVIDKKRIIHPSGLDFKKSYYKYLNNNLYKQIKLFYPYIEVYTDNHGSEAYMLEFEKYVYSQPNNTLLDEFSFRFADSKKEPLIQLADIISGTI